MSIITVSGLVLLRFFRKTFMFARPFVCSPIPEDREGAIICLLNPLRQRQDNQSCVATRLDFRASCSSPSRLWHLPLPWRSHLAPRPSGIPVARCRSLSLSHSLSALLLPSTLAR